MSIFSCTPCRNCCSNIFLGDYNTAEDSKRRIFLSIAPVTGVFMLFINTLSRVDRLEDLSPNDEVWGEEEIEERKYTYMQYGAYSYFSTAVLMIAGIAAGIFPMPALMFPVALVIYGSALVYQIKAHRKELEQY